MLSIKLDTIDIFNPLAPELKSVWAPTKRKQYDALFPTADHNSCLHFVIVTAGFYSGDGTSQGPKLPAALSNLTSEYACTHCATSPNIHFTHQEAKANVNVLASRGVSASFRGLEGEGCNGVRTKLRSPWLAEDSLQTVGSAACWHLLQMHSRR